MKKWDLELITTLILSALVLLIFFFAVVFSVEAHIINPLQPDGYVAHDGDVSITIYPGENISQILTFWADPGRNSTDDYYPPLEIWLSTSNNFTCIFENNSLTSLNYSNFSRGIAWYEDVIIKGINDIGDYHCTVNYIQYAQWELPTTNPNVCGDIQECSFLTVNPIGSGSSSGGGGGSSGSVEPIIKKINVTKVEIINETIEENITEEPIEIVEEVMGPEESYFWIVLIVIVVIIILFVLFYKRK